MKIRLPKITVVIPTRDRADVLCWTLKSVLSQSYERLEVLVCDNCSTDGTKDLVSSYNDPRLKYKRTVTRLGMSQNWELALDAVEDDGWLTVLGDDDGLIPGCLEKVGKLILDTGARAIRSRTCSYSWPQLRGTTSGRLHIPLTSGFEWRSSDEWLNRVVVTGESYENLPVLYNGGFVEVAVIREIKRKTGAFYRSMNPDIYMGIAVASVIDQYLYVYSPLAINGASRHSGGTSNFSGNRKILGSPAEKFHNEPNLPFHPSLLKSPSDLPIVSIPYLVFEAYLQSEILRVKVPQRHNSLEGQLVLIAAAGGPDIREIDDWVKFFSEKAGISFRKVKVMALIVQVKRKLYRYIPGLILRVRTVSIGEASYPILNIYEASFAAGAILDLSPPWYSNVLRLGKRFVRIYTAN